VGKIFYHGRFRGDFMGGTQSDEIVAEMLAQRDTARRAAPPHRHTATPPHRRTATPPHRRTAAPPHRHTAAASRRTVLARARSSALPLGTPPSHRPLTTRPSLRPPLTTRACACQLMNAPDDKGEKKDGKEEL
jgi:serine/arginine repetitive matrix protein 2